MPPNLRCVVAQGWRSIGSRRNFSSSPGSNGETRGTLMDAVYPSFTNFSYWTWSLYGYTIYGATELYKFTKLHREFVELFELNSQKRREMLGE